VEQAPGRGQEVSVLRVSNPNWMKSGAVCLNSELSLLGAGGWIRDLLRSLQLNCSTVLQFYGISVLKPEM